MEFDDDGAMNKRTISTVDERQRDWRWGLTPDE